MGAVLAAGALCMGEFAAAAASPAAAPSETRAAAVAPMAAEVPGVVTGITVESTDGSTDNTLWEWFRVSFTINTASTNEQPGDYFDIDFPDELSVPNRTFAITAADGSVVANCAPNPFGAGGTVTCTFTDYVLTQPNLAGGGYVEAQVVTTTS